MGTWSNSADRLQSAHEQGMSVENLEKLAQTELEILLSEEKDR